MLASRQEGAEIYFVHVHAIVKQHQPKITNCKATGVAVKNTSADSIDVTPSAVTVPINVRIMFFSEHLIEHNFITHSDWNSSRQYQTQTRYKHLCTFLWSTEI